MLVLLIAPSGCGCGAPVPTPDASGAPDATSLTRDALPEDVTLGCGTGLVLRQISTEPPPASGSSPRAASIGNGRLVATASGRWDARVWRISLLVDGASSVTDVATPWDGTLEILPLDDSSGPTVVLFPAASSSSYEWSQFVGAFGPPQPLELPLAPGESVRDISPCDHAAGLALLIEREDGASGLATVAWTGGSPGGGPPYYPLDGAFGPARVLPPQTPPALASCVADAHGEVWVATLPSTGGAPVVTRVPTGAGVPGMTRLGDGPGDAILMTAEDGTVVGFALAGGTLTAYSLAEVTAPFPLAVTPADPAVFTGNLLAAQSIGGRVLVLFANEVGTWGIVLEDDGVSFRPPVSLSDLRCSTADGFHSRPDGALHLLANCTLGVAGTQLVDFSLCGAV